jgi:hypothetical protein
MSAVKRLMGPSDEGESFALVSLMGLRGAFLVLFAAMLIIAPARAQQTSDNPFTSFTKSLTAVPDPTSLRNSGDFYVPVFSSIRMETGKTRLDLAITLSIHNSSETMPLVLNRIDYFDTAGALVQRYIPHAVALRPFGTVEIFISRDDIRGGSGANFIVSWAATDPIAEPIIEAVMIGSVGTNSFSFTTRGQAIRIVSNHK